MDEEFRGHDDDDLGASDSDVEEFDYSKEVLNVHGHVAPSEVGIYQNAKFSLEVTKLSRLAWGEAERYQWFDKACGQVYEVEAFIAKGRGDYYEEGLITWFGVQPSS
uniref:Uncharacterized protein n=1 Tax=Brassica campestris TaxID=3711 RepID=M4FE65_BRACM